MVMGEKFVGVTPTFLHTKTSKGDTRWREALNRSKWVEKYILSALRLPGISLPDHVLLQAAWKTLEEERVPEEIGGTALPKEVKARLKTLLKTLHRIEEESKTTKGAMLRGKRKKRMRPRGKGNTPALQGLKRIRQTLSTILPWEKKDPTPTIIACALEGRSFYSFWQSRKEELPLHEQPYTCNKTTMKAVKKLTEEDLEKLQKEIKQIPRHCLSKLPKKERKRAKNLLRKKGVLALDFKEQPYYGKKLSDKKLLHPVNKGNRRGTVAMILSRCDRGIRLPQQAHYLPAETTKAEILPKIRGELKEAKLLLTDSGLYNHEVVGQLANWETPFLYARQQGKPNHTPCPGCSACSPGKHTHPPTQFWRHPIYLHFCVRGPKRGQGEKHEISVFASREESPGDVREYGLRWGVENQNRDFQKFLIPTSSTSATVRLFFFILSLHLLRPLGHPEPACPHPLV
ncbi:MAG: hypothetical protein QXR19_14915 [Candidatus Jordarchaeaceae archaeon]